MGDTGLLISLAFDEGMIMENIIAQMLTATGKNYTFSSLNKFRNKYKEYLSTGYVLHTG